MDLYQTLHSDNGKCTLCQLHTKHNHLITYSGNSWFIEHLNVEDNILWLQWNKTKTKN